MNKFQVSKYSITLLAFFCLLPPLQGCVPVIAAGIGTGAVMAQDRRSTGTVIDDSSSELAISQDIGKQLSKEASVSVTVYNHKALLTGAAINDTIKSKAGDIAKTYPGITTVYNEIRIAIASGLATDASDSLVTSIVKARLINVKGLNAEHIKVVTDDHIVYLMGLVTHKEAQLAAQCASTSDGVSKVVTLFEYID